MISLDWISLAIGFAVGIGGTSGVAWILTRRSVSEPSSTPASAPVDAPAPVAEAPRTGPSVDATGTDPLGPPPTRTAATVTADTADPGPRSPTRTELGRISERVLLHLLKLRATEYGAAAPLGRTQAGMCAELDIRQGSLTRVLARLEASGAVTSRRGHVEGVGQRLKVYELTTLGEAVARPLRGRAERALRSDALPARGGPRPPTRPAVPSTLHTRRGGVDPPENSVEYIR